MSKYDALGQYLRGQYAAEVRMTFAEIERVVGLALPPSARKHRPWWSNNPDNSVMTRVWLAAGFRTEQVDIPGETLVFARVNEEEAMQPGFGEASVKAVANATAIARHPAIGAMKGMITIMPGVDLTAPADPEWVETLDDPRGWVGGLDDPKPADR